MLRGIDISSYQKFSDYSLLNQSGLAFVYVKASEGLYKDPMFTTHDEGFARTSLLKGAYHFHRFADDAKSQADVFIRTVAPTFSALDLPPALDIEDTATHLSPAQCENEIQIWLDNVEQALKVKPIIYTGRGYWTDPGRMNNSRKFEAYKLWQAQYSPDYLPAFGAWQQPTTWQYSQTGTVPGLVGAAAHIDLDYYLGDSDGLWNLTASSGIGPSATYSAKVEVLQNTLNNLGFNSGKPDGFFGTNTLTALHQWQMQNGIPQQDSVTPRMWELLFGFLQTNQAV